nr:glycosyltransferase family 1 protein [uncultured Tolumonas sp.]
MKILIDLQSCQSPSRFRGIGRYSLDLLISMLKIGLIKYDFHILLNTAHQGTILELRAIFEPILGRDNIHTFDGVLGSSGINDNATLQFSSEVIRDLVIRQIAPDFIHITSLFEGMYDDTTVSITEGIPTGVTFYDLIPMIYPDKYLSDRGLKEWYYNKLENLKKSDVLFAISESSANEATEIINIEKDKVINISSAVSDDFKNKIKDVTKNDIIQTHSKFGIHKKFIMYTANLDDRKNINGLLNAYAILDESVRNEYTLVIVTNINDISKKKILKQARKVGLTSSEFIITGYVSDEELVALYKSCHLFVFPSLHEGFGLPCLEAMECGAPVIGSNCTSVPEVIGNKLSLFDPYDPYDMARLIKKSLTNTDFRKYLFENSNVQKNKFSWDNSAKIVLDRIFKLVSSSDSKKSREYLLDHSISMLKNFKNKLTDGQLKEIAKKLDLALVKDSPELLVDVTYLAESDAKTGIQRVVRSIVLEWGKFEQSEYIIRLVRLGDDGFYYYANEYEYKIWGSTLKRKAGYVAPNKGDVFLGLDLTIDISEKARNLFEVWRERGVKISFVVYDLLPIEFPEFFALGIQAIFPKWIRFVIDNADRLICISKSTENSVRNYLTEHNVIRSLPIKLSHFSLGADFGEVYSDYSNDYLPSELRTLDLSKTFLMVGTIEPRKGYYQVLEAFENINNDYKLIIVGKAGWCSDDVLKKLNYYNGQMENIFWLDDCDDELLSFLYKKCCALIVSSYGEGFGLPLIEAARMSMPIIARNLDVFKEIIDSEVFYFDNSKEPRIITEAILEWISIYEKSKCGRVHYKFKCKTWDESSTELYNSLF